MTTLNFQLARGLSKMFKKVINYNCIRSWANRGPWKIFEEKGIKLIEINLLLNGELDYNDFENKIIAKQL